MRQEWKDGDVEARDNLSMLPNLGLPRVHEKRWSENQIKSLKRGDDLTE